MPSENKKRKHKHRFLAYGELKTKGARCKGIRFFTSSERQRLKKETLQFSEENPTSESEEVAE